MFEDIPSSSYIIIYYEHLNINIRKYFTNSIYVRYCVIFFYYSLKWK